MRSSPQRIQRSVIERPEPSHKAARLTPPIAAGETMGGFARSVQAGQAGIAVANLAPGQKKEGRTKKVTFSVALPSQ